MKNYLKLHRRLAGILGSCVAIVVAIIYAVVVPEEASSSDGLLKIILLYGHTFCWFLLSLVSLGWALRKPKKLLVVLGYSALASYVVFVGSMLLAKPI